MPRELYQLSLATRKLARREPRGTGIIVRNYRIIKILGDR